MLDGRSIFFFNCAILVAVLVAGQRSGYNTYAAPENGTCYKRVPYDEAVIANLSQGLIKTESTTPPPGVQTWITIIDCCDGYRREDEYSDCEFYCKEGCSGGNCTGPNECTCEEGWQVDRGECRPTCRQRCPSNSYCFSPDVCECLFGFEKINDICQPICQHNCRNGDCVGPADCRCHRGYFLNDTRHCEPICESGCPHGYCAAPGVCSCDQGYVNELYNSESCIPECPSECVNGECVTPNVCTCKEGYQQNDNGTCEAQCEETCPENNGLCVAPNQCGCKAGFILDIQKKNCIKLPKNESYPSRGGFPSRNNQGQYEPKQYGVNNVYNTQQNRPYSTTQRPNHGRNNYPSSQGGGYQTDNPYGYRTTENPQGVIGLQDHVTTQNPLEHSYEVYGSNQSPRPQRPYTPQETYSTSTPYPGSRGEIDGSTTYRPPVNDPRYTTVNPIAPSDSYPTEIPDQGSNGIWYAGQPQYNYGNGGNRPANGSLQGPFAPQSPHRYHTTPSPIRPDDPRQTVGPYGPYDSHTQRPWSNNQNRPYGRTDPNGQQTPNNYPKQRPNLHDQNRPYNPHSSTTPRDQEGVETGQNRPYDRADPNGQRAPNNHPNQRPYPYDQNRPYNPYASATPRDPEGVKTGQRRPYEPQPPNTLQPPYNPFAPISPHEAQGVKNSQGRPVYGSQGPDQRYNPYAPSTPYSPTNAPRTPNGQGTQTDIYSRSSVMQSNPQSGVSYSYGIDHLNRVPQIGRPINGQPINSIPRPFIVTDSYAPPQSSNIGGIIIIDGPQVPGSSQLEPLCNGPCINSHCIGLNLCMCEIGFIPDPRNPGGNACVPV